ncbi:MAG: RagB/SusD family nutrient uptake outer membrane protein [Bacteroidales bacterium]|nr:RagB/SusD family nutrient uptake outer membrane protein [Candidatus Liminaster caballi]
MKKILYISTLALFAGASLMSCSDFLEAENKSAGGQTAEEYFSTAEGLKAWRNNTFYGIRAIATAIDINEQGTDLYWPSRGRGESDYVRYSLSAENSDVKKFYVSCFELVNSANGLIYYGGDTYKADALFIRALGYYYLTQHFGPVPYSTTYINNAERSYGRVDLKTIYDNCISDLKAAYDLAPERPAEYDGTVNKRAVAALCAKFNLAAAWDLETTMTDEKTGEYTVTGTSYAAEAKAWAEKAISGISLTQSFEQKWSPANEDKNPETFFSVQYDRASFPGTGGGHGLQNDFGSYYGDITASYMKSVGSDKVPSNKSLKLFEKGDERYDATFMTTFYNTESGTWSTEGYYAYYNAADLSKLPVAYCYAPYYVTKAEFEAKLVDVAAAIVANCGDYKALKTAPYAYLMQDPVVAYKFNGTKFVVDSSTDKGGAAYTYATLQTRMNYAPCVKKWDDPETPQSNGNTSECYRDIVMLHASESYLVAAEACALMNDETGCLNYVNEVRSRAKAAKITSVASYEPAFTFTGTYRMVDLVLDERARELYAEGTRWMDLRRTHQLVKYTVAYNCLIDKVEDMMGAGEVKWYRPIPSDEISSNTSADMYQNPGY